MTIGEALLWGAEELAAEAAPRRDTELLLRSVTGWERAFVLSHDEAMLNADAERAFRAAISRRALGEPVQYIAGEQQFWDLSLKVTPAVLIPRPETEHVIEAVLARVSRATKLRIADIGTGSGAIAIALAKELPQASILATDISAGALNIARENAVRHEVESRIEFVICDLLPDMSNHFDIIASNPPYIADAERASLSSEVKDFEPRQALFSGASGYDMHRRLVPVGARALKPGGWLILEIGAGQAGTLREMLRDWQDVETFRDLASIERVVCARRK